MTHASMDHKSIIKIEMTSQNVTGFSNREKGHRGDKQKATFIDAGMAQRILIQKLSPDLT